MLAGSTPWRELRAAVHDPYIVYGALNAIAYLAIGLALLPSLARAGWGGRLFAWILLAGAPITALSYLGTPESSPLHVLWGAEGYQLVLLGVAGIPAAITARGWPVWSRVLLGATIVVLVLGLLAFGYYPNGPLIALAIAAAVLIGAAPARPAPPTPAGPRESARTHSAA